ncbi:MAG: hypothetical protein ABIJ75_07960 [Actinomycetota bacterium]
MTAQETCEQRIDRHLKGRITNIRAIVAGIDTETMEPYEDDDRQYEDLDSLMLGGDATIVVRLQMSTGGPGDEFLFDYTPGETRPNRIRYRFLDWYDDATRTLNDEDTDLIEAAYGEWAYTIATNT